MRCLSARSRGAAKRPNRYGKQAGILPDFCWTVEALDVHAPEPAVELRVCMTRLGYEKELVGVLEGLVRDMDRKIERQKERADKESAPKALTDADRAKLDDMLARQKGAFPAANTATLSCVCGQLEAASAACVRCAQ